MRTLVRLLMLLGVLLLLGLVRARHSPHARGRSVKPAGRSVDVDEPTPPPPDPPPRRRWRWCPRRLRRVAAPTLRA